MRVYEYAYELLNSLDGFIPLISAEQSLAFSGSHGCFGCVATGTATCWTHNAGATAAQLRTGRNVRPGTQRMLFGSHERDTTIPIKTKINSFQEQH